MASRPGRRASTPRTQAPAALFHCPARRTARDVLPGLMKTCNKLGVSFFRYLGDRLHVPDAVTVPPLPDLVRQAATTA